jgi:hypothetical protein
MYCGLGSKLVKEDFEFERIDISALNEEHIDVLAAAKRMIIVSV